jgi:hypothetical protein
MKLAVVVVGSEARLTTAVEERKGAPRRASLEAIARKGYLQGCELVNGFAELLFPSEKRAFCQLRPFRTFCRCASGQWAEFIRVPRRARKSSV